MLAMTASMLVACGGAAEETKDAATDAWQSGDDRFPAFASPLARIPAPPTPWRR